MSCEKADKVLSAKKVAIGETVDAKKATIDAKAALKLLRSAERVLIAKGKKTIDISIDSRVSDDDLAPAIGPTGNLRAPTIRRGRVIAVGFSEDMLDAFLR